MSAAASHDDVDIEAQIQIDKPDSESHFSNRSHATSHGVNDGGHHSAVEVTNDEHQVGTNCLRHETPSPVDAPPAQSTWKPLKADEPFFTKVPESKDMKEDWVKAMGKADDGMCRGWKDQIDTLIIFAGLFSATVTAFTIESYQWLDETPANTLARLQLRGLLNTTHDPAMNHLAPATFHVSPSSVAINALWFASLTFSLAAVVVSILCKQWLHEYQRYDNFTTDEVFLIRGLRHRGLQAWKVPQIISFLPILLQTALVLFLVGILILLWSLQTMVASFATLIIGVTFIFLVITTILPSIQYLVPIFETQCAYKSSQSWSFFAISAFWLFDFKEFTHWGSIDQWEIYNIDDGLGRTLSSVYQSFGNNFDSFLNLYNTLVDKSLKPTRNGDLAVLRDFIDGLSPSSLLERYSIKDPRRLSRELDIYQDLGRVRQLRLSLDSTLNYIDDYKSRFRVVAFADHPGHSSLIETLPLSIYYPRTQLILRNFLQYSGHDVHQLLYNRSIEHSARSLDFNDGKLKGNVSTDSIADVLYHIHNPPIPYEPGLWNILQSIFITNEFLTMISLEIAKWLIGFHAHLFRESRFPSHVIDGFICSCYPKLMESHHQCGLDPSPAILLKHMQECVDQAPDSGTTKFQYIQYVFLGFSRLCITAEKFVGYHTSDSDKEYAISFIRFLVDLSETEEFQQVLGPFSFWRNRAQVILTSFREYFNENPNIPPSDVNNDNLSLRLLGTTEAMLGNM